MVDYQSTAALVFLICVLPLVFYICFSDLKRMKIPNWSTDLLLGIFAVVGLFVLPWEVWAWRWANFGVILVVGIIANQIAGVGAGDAKYAAAAAPFVDPAHIIVILYLFAACLLGAFFAHRILRAIPPVRAMAPDWISWGHRKFPMGLAISGAFALYLLFVAFPPLYDLFRWNNT